MFTTIHQPAAASLLRARILRALAYLNHPTASLGDMLLALEVQGLPLEETGPAIELALRKGWLALTPKGDLRDGSDANDKPRGGTPARFVEAVA